MTLLGCLLLQRTASANKCTTTSRSCGVFRKRSRSTAAFLTGYTRFHGTQKQPLKPTCITGLNPLFQRQPPLSFHRQQQQQQRSLNSSSSQQQENTATISSSKEELDTQEALYQELQWLSTEIRRHDNLYYNTDSKNGSDSRQMMITDDDYDALVRREEEICKKYPDLQQRWETESGLGKQATRVGGRVGIEAPTPRFQKRKHLIPMLSLDNITTKDQLNAWLERLRKKLITESEKKSKLAMAKSITILTEPKLDGLSLSIRYQLEKQDNNSLYCYKLVWASTRGDGRQGQDVTRPIQQGMKLPTILQLKKGEITTDNIPTVFEVRGEVVLHNSLFDELKRQSIMEQQQEAVTESDDIEIHSNATSAPILKTATFSNPRNAASGILLRKYNEADGDEDAATLQLQSKLSFYAYDLVVDSTAVPELNWTTDALSSRQRLQEWGFHVAEPTAITSLELHKRNGVAADADGNGSNESTPEYREWTDLDIQPILDYHEALGKYREEQQQQRSTTSSKMTNEKPGKKDYPWGDYDMDGCVHKVSQVSIRRLVGSSNRAPRWAIAHKFPSQSAITSLLDVEVQVGRKSGALTPVAILEPVELAGGVTVTRATLHNFQHMQQILLYGSRAGTAGDSSDDSSSEKYVLLDVDSLLKQKDRPLLARGTKVLVRRAGDVIPQIVQLAEPPKTASTTSKQQETDNSSSSWIDLSAPLTCPACGSPAIVDTLTGARSKASNGTNKLDESSAFSADSEGQVLRCGGPPLLCPPRAVGALVHAYSRDALDISGLSEAKIQQLMSLNNTSIDSEMNSTEVKLRFPSDIFAIAKNPQALEVIAKLPGWGPKSAQNLANAVNKVATEGVSLARFIYSLSIRFSGVHSSKLIATAYGSATAFLDAVVESSEILESAAVGESIDEEQHQKQPFAILADKENEVSKGIGPALLSSLIAFSKEKELLQAAHDLASAVVIHDDEDFHAVGCVIRSSEGIADSTEPSEAKPFQGMKIVFTGSLADMNLSRKDAQALAKSLGAKATPASISKATDLVVVGEKGGGKKLDAARKIGVKVMDIDAFMELVEKAKKATEDN